MPSYQWQLNHFQIIKCWELSCSIAIRVPRLITSDKSALLDPEPY
jgi:hypothetical protein